MAENQIRIKSLIDRENKIILDWSPKVGCTILTKMFLRNMGLLEEALAYNSWIHEYREHVFHIKDQVSIEDLKNPDYYKFKVVRNPFRRVVSSYLRVMDNPTEHNESVQNAIKHMSWKRSSDVSFSRFIDYLESIDIRNCDPHQKQQKRDFEYEIPNCFNKIVKLEDLDKGIDEVNKEGGFSFDLQGLSSHHHQEIKSSNSRNVAEIKWSKFKNNIPPYPMFYNNSLAKRVADIYKDDIETYDYSWESFLQGK